MKLRKFALAPIVVAIAAAGFLPLNAAADTYYINLGNGPLSGLTTPFAQVDVNLTDSTHASVTFKALSSGNFSYAFGGAQAIDLNVNGSVTASVSQDGAGTLSFDGSGNADGWGTFNTRWGNSDGWGDRAWNVTVDLTKTSGTWTTAASVLTPNADGNSIAAHIFPCNSALGCQNNQGLTGFATVGAIPEPETYAMLLAGLGLMGFIARRRQRSLAA